ncbi:MAG: HD domain-containing protein [Microgenomates group bacterium]
MQLKQLYTQFYIMPQLETHMLKVAGVAKIVAENWKDKCDVKLITDLCLLHDMGNIVKFDLTKSDGKFGKIENLEYWQGVQQTYWDKYGHDAHEATTLMLREAKLDQFIPFIDEEEKLYFAEAKEGELAKTSIAAIILMYADCRVKPSGVVSYRERIDDLKARYGGVGTPTWYDWTYWFEEWMQSKVKIDLNSIAEASVTPIFDELLTYTV